MKSLFLTSRYNQQLSSVNPELIIQSLLRNSCDKEVLLNIARVPSLVHVNIFQHDVIDTQIVVCLKSDGVIATIIAHTTLFMS